MPKKKKVYNSRKTSKKVNTKNMGMGKGMQKGMTTKTEMMGGMKSMMKKNMG